MATTTHPTIDCPHCHQQYPSKPELDGRCVRCQTCRQEFRVTIKRPQRIPKPSHATSGPFDSAPAFAPVGATTGRQGKPTIPCPNCHHEFPRRPELIGHRVRCPVCQHQFTVIIKQPNPEPNTPTTSWIIEETQAQAPPVQLPPAPPPPPVKTIITKQHATTKPHHPSQAGGVSRNPRLLRRWQVGVIRFGPLLLLPLLPSIDPNHSMGLGTGLFCMFAPILWAIYGSRGADALASQAIAMTIHSIQCPGCGDLIPLYNRWNCGCGYHSHKDTNLMINKCPSCGGKIGHINCPRCDVTILI